MKVYLVVVVNEGVEALGGKFYFNKKAAVGAIVEEVDDEEWVKSTVEELNAYDSEKVLGVEDGEYFLDVRGEDITEYCIKELEAPKDDVRMWSEGLWGHGTPVYVGIFKDEDGEIYAGKYHYSASDAVDALIRDTHAKRRRYEEFSDAPRQELLENLYYEAPQGEYYIEELKPPTPSLWEWRV